MLNKDDKLQLTYNSKMMNALLVGLPESKLVKVMDYTTIKVIWDDISCFYEGNNKVKKYELQGYKM